MQGQHIVIRFSQGLNLSRDPWETACFNLPLLITPNQSLLFWRQSGVMIINV